MLNTVILIGNVGKTPEIRTMQDGTMVASFSVATSESWKDKNTSERKQKTEWHNISVFNKAIIDIIKLYVKKGSRVYIEGSIQNDKWDKDGVTHYMTKIVIKPYSGNLRLLDGKSEESQNHSTNPSASQNESSQNLDDEIPF